MQSSTFSRRTLLISGAATAIATPAAAQDVGEGLAWIQATTTVWAEILQVPTALMRGSTFAAYSPATTDRELDEARALAATKRAEMEVEIARCRAMIEATPPAPVVAEGWGQGIVDQSARDQHAALDRLARLALLLENNSNSYVSGRVPFAAAMRISNWSLFGEVDWIMASTTKLARVGQRPNAFVDLWWRSASLDWFGSSVVRCGAAAIGHGDPPADITPAALSTLASEMREVRDGYSAADQFPLDVAPDARGRVRRALPRLVELANAHAGALDELARIWPSILPADLIAGGDIVDRVPRFMAEAGPLIGDIGSPT